MKSRQTIIIFREELLGASETFVLGQGEALSRFQPFYLGLRRRAGLELPESRTHVVSKAGLTGKWQRARFKLLGPSPSLLSRLAGKHPALIHAHFGPDACNAVALAQALGVPLLVTLHGYDVTTCDEQLPRLYIQRRDLLKNYASRFICVSEFIRKQAIAAGFPADKTVVHYTGIDLEVFHPQPATSRLPVVLFVGRLVPKKGCEYLIRAMVQVQEKMPEAQLIVIGQGPLRAQLEAQAASVLKNYRFVGEQKPAAVRDWMNRAMALCTPSIVARSGDAEGFGMIFAEAQAMGLPVASFDTGGIPEAVGNGKTGFLVPSHDEKALGDCLLLLLRDRQRWDRMSAAGQDRASRLFDIRKQTPLLENIYDAVLAGSRKRLHEQQSQQSAAWTKQHDGSTLPHLEQGLHKWEGLVNK